MAFPTTAVLATFTGSNGAGLGGTFTTLGATAAAPLINGNAASNVSAANPYVGAYLNGATYGPDCEAFATQTADGTYLAVFARLTTPTGAYDGYQASWSGTALTVQRNDDAVQTQLGAAVTLAKTAGTKVGLECIGSSISVYADTGSGFVQQAQRTDATYTTAGNIGFDLFDASGLIRVDDLGGGTFVAASASGKVPRAPNVPNVPSIGD